MAVRIAGVPSIGGTPLFQAGKLKKAIGRLYKFAEGQIMNTMTETLELLTDFDVKTRKQLAYLYRMASEHPTSAGRKRAAIEHSSLTNYLADVHDSWRCLRIALWPRPEDTNVPR